MVTFNKSEFQINFQVRIKSLSIFSYNEGRYSVYVIKNKWNCLT